MKKSCIAGLLAMMMMLLAFGVRAEAAGWVTDFAQASKTAKKSGKYMLVDFSGSDWCGWCQKLEAEVFSKPEFKQYAQKNLICVLVDFPQSKYQSDDQKAKNQQLSVQYAIEGYPTVLILSPSGQLVATTGYQDGGAANYVKYLKQVIAAYKRK